MRNKPNIYCSFCPGAPIINGVPGSFLETLKAVLINGTTPVSYPNIVVLDGVAKITALSDYQVFFNEATIVVEGCDEPLCNGKVVVLEHGQNYFCWETEAADGTYGGNIKVRQPPAGWELLFSGTNDAVIASGNMDSLGINVRIIDTNARQATLEFYEHMTSLTAGINKVDPVAVGGSGNMFVANKSYYASTMLNHWWIVADNTTVHVNIEIHATTAVATWNDIHGNATFSFGELELFAENNNKNFYFQSYRGSTTFNGYLMGYSNWNYNLGTQGVYSANGTYNSSFILYNDYDRYIARQLFLCTPTFGVDSVNRPSGNYSNIAFNSTVMPENFATEYYAFSMLGSGTFSLLGKVVEARHYNVNCYPMFEKYKIAMINNKKYINLPVHMPFSNSDLILFGNQDVGLLPILISDVWD
jgi:hypothetical protein